MSNSLEIAIEKIRSIGDLYCENQMYIWPGFHHDDPDPEAFFRQEGIEFDGELFIRYPVKRTFNPIPMDQIEDEERELSVSLPIDYEVLLHHFGEFHLPGSANITLVSPAEALKTTYFAFWCNAGGPLSALAISPYNATSDGNCIGFLRDGDSFQPAIYEFDHELVDTGKNPSLWTKRIGDSLADFLLEYLDRHIES